MKKKEAWYAVIGGMVGAVLTMAAGSIAPLVAQTGATDANFGKITCEELEMLGPDGVRRVWIATGKNSGFVQLGSGSVMIHGAEDNGFVGVFGNETVALSVAGDKGRIEVRGKGDDPAKAIMGISKDGGGGRVTAYRKGGVSGGWAGLSADEHGGRVDVYGKQSKSGAMMEIDEHGGHVSVRGKGTYEARAAMAVNEYGNGAVSTWDKNGYRLATLK